MGDKTWEVKIKLPDHQIFEMKTIKSTAGRLWDRYPEYFIEKSIGYFFENGIVFLIKVTNKPIAKSLYYEIETGVFVNFTEKPTVASEIFDCIPGSSQLTWSHINYKYRYINTYNGYGTCSTDYVTGTDFMSGTDSNKEVVLVGSDLLKFFFVHPVYGVRTLLNLVDGIDDSDICEFNSELGGVKSGWLISELKRASEQIDVQDEVNSVKSKYKNGTLSQRLFTFCKKFCGAGEITTDSESIKKVMENIDELEILIKFFRKNNNRFLVSHINQDEIDGYNSLIKIYKVNKS